VKNMDRLYERLTPVERFKIAVAAFGRGDMAEVDRLNDSTTWRAIKVQEPAYFDRLQRISWLSLYFTVHSRNQQITVLAAFSAMIIHLLGSDSDRDKGEATEDDDARFDELMELCDQRISRLKALYAAWEEFCSGLGVSASDVDKMIGMPLMGGLGQLEMIQEIVGEVSPDEEYQRECLDHMRNFWKTKLEDRYAALG
jgi:hypothetical protein